MSTCCNHLEARHTGEGCTHQNEDKTYCQCNKTRSDCRKEKPKRVMSGIRYAKNMEAALDSLTKVTGQRQHT